MAITIVGARYVPIYVGEWDAGIDYEALCIVTDSIGNSYTSKIPVPAGTPLYNTDYWALTGTYNALDHMIVDSFNELYQRTDDDRADIGDLQHDVQTIGNDLTTLTGKLDAGDYTTAAIYPTPRASVVVNSQADFEAFVARFYNRTREHVRIKTGGTYKFQIPDNSDWLVFNGCEIHVYIDNAAGAVTLDLNGMTYYNGHFRVIVEGSSSCRIIDSMPDGRKAYFEDCSVNFDSCVFGTTLQVLGGWTSVTNCTWADYDNVCCLRVSSGTCYLNNCDFTVASIPDGHAVFGIGNNGRLLLGGRMSFVHIAATDATVFRGIGREMGTVVNLAGMYDLVNETAYGAGNRGTFGKLKTDSLYLRYIGINHAPFYLADTAGIAYSGITVEDFTTYTGE